MGKTFKNGYFGLNPMRSKQCYKKIDRKRRKIQYKNECDWIYKNYDGLDLNTNFKSINLRKSVVLSNEASATKIGYLINTSLNLNEVEKYIFGKKILSSFEPKNIKDSPDEFKNFKDIDKIKILSVETKCKKNRDSFMTCYHNFLELSLKNMEKQIKRRGKIGYFKGHDKEKY